MVISPASATATRPFNIRPGRAKKINVQELTAKKLFTSKLELKSVGSELLLLAIFFNRPEESAVARHYVYQWLCLHIPSIAMESEVRIRIGSMIGAALVRESKSNPGMRLVVSVPTHTNTSKCTYTYCRWD